MSCFFASKIPVFPVSLFVDSQEAERLITHSKSPNEPKATGKISACTKVIAKEQFVDLIAMPMP